MDLASELEKKEGSKEAPEEPQAAVVKSEEEEEAPQVADFSEVASEEG